MLIVYAPVVLWYRINFAVFLVLNVMQNIFLFLKLINKVELIGVSSCQAAQTVTFAY